MSSDDHPIIGRVLASLGIKALGSAVIQSAEELEAAKLKAAKEVVRRIANCSVYVVPTHYVPMRCKGCGAVTDLRHGFCFDCLEPYLLTAQRELVAEGVIPEGTKEVKP